MKSKAIYIRLWLMSGGVVSNHDHRVVQAELIEVENRSHNILILIKIAQRPL